MIEERIDFNNIPTREEIMRSTMERKIGELAESLTIDGDRTDPKELPKKVTKLDFLKRKLEKM